MILVVLLRFVLRRRREASICNQIDGLIYMAAAFNVLYVCLIFTGRIHQLHMLLRLFVAKVCKTAIHFILFRTRASLTMSI